MVLSTLRPNKNDMNNKSDTVESLMKHLVLRELRGQIYKVSIAKTNKPKISAFWKARPKYKHQCSTSTEKSRKYRKTESKDSKIYQKKKD